MIHYQQKSHNGKFVDSMAKGKALGHDGIHVENFQQLWPALGSGFYRMILKSIEHGALHEGSLEV